MLFNSIQFLLFFPIVLLVYYVLPMKVRYLWLLVSSYYFYMCWNAKYAILLVISTIVTYLSGLLLEKIKQAGMDEPHSIKWKKCVVAGSFIINLSILFYFKYINFAFNLIAGLLGSINIHLNAPKVDVLLPVGISFYTFQALSYTMDVFRDEIYAERNIFRYALFVSFFPQLVAGPIERSKNLLKQLAQPGKFRFENLREGTLLMIWGYFLKLVIADRIALFVDTVYGDHSTYGGWYLIIATVLFAFQIYCDFAGYSTIAMGSAKILGIQLMENFNAPYLSSSVSEFWRKWHISLTSWFKDYLYIPLGGNRKGKVRKYFNKMVVFLISGLWHGASLSFVVWGGLNGVYQVVGEIIAPYKDRFTRRFRIRKNLLCYSLLRVVVTFILVDISWIFFRADGLKDAIRIIKHMFFVTNPWILFDGSLYTCGLSLSEFWLMIFALMVLLLSDYCKYKGIVIRKVIMAQDGWFRYIFIAFAIMTVLVFGKYGPAYDQANFIYFQF